MINTIVLLFLAYLTPGAELTSNIVLNGYTDNQIETVVIKNNNEYQDLTKLINTDANVAQSTFLDGVLVLKELEKQQDPSTFDIVNFFKKDNKVKIFYNVSDKSSVPQDSKNPFVLISLKPFFDKDIEVELVDLEAKKPLFANQSISGTNPKYSNLLNEQGERLYIEYFPLDKGNVWTYSVDKDGIADQKSFSISSTYENWSVFDNFFGKDNVALTINNQGELLVATNSGRGPFYNHERLKITKSNEPFTVGAGKFNDLLIVTIPKNDKLWFKDIYVKDVGLIYHEHSSPKGTVIYRLDTATIKGKSISSK